MHHVDLGGDAKELARLMEGADTLIHLAWQTTDGATDPSTAAASEVNRRILCNVLEAAGKSAPAGFVHLSSATVYGAWPDNPIPLTEDAPLRPNPEFAFAVDKAEGERLVADWAEAHPATTVCVLRPPATLGSPVRPLYRALTGTRTPRSDGATGRPVQFLHADDLAAAVVLAGEQRLSGVYNVAADNGISEDSARALVGGVARVPLPRVVATAVAHLSWDLWRAGVPREARAYALHPWVIAGDKLKAAGWAPRYSSEEALVATDDRPHWDDLPPGRRQNFTVLIAAGASAAAVAAAAGAAWFIRKRRKGLRGS
jgi:nucleoside-diphosphate-sugar epimerase